MLKGLVTKNTGSMYSVLLDGGDSTVNCKLKGNYRLKDVKSTNPVVIGDRVSVEANEGETWYITDIETRRNCLVRKSSNLSKQTHILGANIDLALLVVTLKSPETSTTFIDRFIASAEAYDVPVVLLFNKIDLLDDGDNEYLCGLKHLYDTVGYESVNISALTGEGFEELEVLIRGRVSLLSGHSGVGKSTVMNRIVPDSNLRTGIISDVHDMGMHTTTHSEMLKLPQGGFIIDTPGIKGFGVYDFNRMEVSHYFKEIFLESRHCRFSDCTHINEPGCAVRRALEEQRISQSRYTSYLSILDEERDESKIGGSQKYR